MVKIKRILCLFLMILSVFFLFSGCTKLPKDEIEVRIVTAEKTYKRSENVTDCFLLLDVLNGKKQTIEKINITLDVKFQDGSVQTFTLVYDEPIQYLGSYPVMLSYTLDGRAESIEKITYDFELLSYWGSFGDHIIFCIVGYVILAIVMVVLARAEMETALSLVAGADVLFCIIYVIFSPFAASIYVIGGTILSFLPFLISNALDY